MSQEHSAPSNPKEDVPSMTQQTPRVAPQPLPPFPLFGEGNPVVHTLARYWRLFNDPGLTPRAPNLGSSVVTSEAFLGLASNDGGSDPMEHVAAFRAQMALYGTSDAITCRVFPMTLRGIARGWYSQLPPASIRSFDQLAREFKANFLASAQPKPTTASLLRMRQKEDEPLGPYLARFIEEIRAIPDAHPLLVIQAFIIGIRPSHFFWSLVEHPPATVPEMLQRASQYVIAKALVVEKREDQKRPRVESSRGLPSRLPRRRMERSKQTVPRLPNTPLNSTRTEIFLQI
ncbi:hypothetical protein BHE74_00029210 [Ensete ventricosum]|nr:hypothetical protein BHE74_00029210 [Ensete ventricosum]